MVSLGEEGGREGDVEGAPSSESPHPPVQPSQDGGEQRHPTHPLQEAATSWNSSGDHVSWNVKGTVFLYSLLTPCLFVFL